MAEIKTLYLETIAKVQLSYRRYTTGTDCPGPYKYHNALVPFRTEPLQHPKAIVGTYLDLMPDMVSGCWPVRCDHCPYMFQPKDHFQLFAERMYHHPKMGQTILRVDRGVMPVGWIYDAYWLREIKGYDRGPDGLCLVCMTPGGEWCIDGPSTNGPGWTRTGPPDKLTVTPSIVAGPYHGWLRDGTLIDA